jgi:hypothetical protein
MDGIKRKSFNEASTPETEVVRRASLAPEPRPETYPISPEDRISSNPFFKKSPVFSRETPRLSQAPQKPSREEGSGFQGLMPSKKLLLGGFGGVALLVIGFFGANLFSSAHVEIIPLTETASIDNEFSAVKDTEMGQLAFEFMSLSEEKTKEVPATMEQKVQKKASGKVTIKNEYSAQSQRLIKNTRLETPDNKIFRIDESVVVPGAKMSGSTVVAPGSVDAIVYAEAAGEEYNIKPSGTIFFTIPGFKGDPRYAKFTAMTDQPITGGFSGTVKIPSDSDVEAAKKELKDDLLKIVVEKARANIKEGTTFFPGSMVVKFPDVPQEFTTDDKAKIVVRATVSVFFFDTELLTKKIVESVLPKYADTALELSNRDDISFSFIDPVDGVVLSDLSKIRFNIKGEGIFVGKIDSEKIISDLVGKSKNVFTEVVATQSNVKKATSTLFPMWNTTFPSDPEKISIKITQE